MNKKFIITFIFIFFFFNFVTLTTLSISDVGIDSGIDFRTTNLINSTKKEHYKTLSTVSMLLERQSEGKTEVLLQLRKNTRVGWTVFGILELVGTLKKEKL